MRRYLLFALLFALLAVAPGAPHGRYLVTWASETRYPASGEGRDVLAIYDIGDTDFGHLVGFAQTATPAQDAHHMNYSMPSNHVVVANDFTAAHSYVFDIRDPSNPVIVASFTNAGEFNHPHSFATLSNGNVLATFQIKGTDQPGGLVELNSSGQAIRANDAADPAADPNIRPYSVLVIEGLDRVVTTSSAMPPLKTNEPSHVVQVWRLSDLKLLETIDLPKRPHFSSVGRGDPDEARLLGDGKTVLVKTSECGLFELTDISGSNPQARYVYDFGGRFCAGVPVVAGNYWIEPCMSGHNLTSLDISDPSNPVEVSHLYLGPTAVPHWTAIEPGTGNLVITGYGSLLNRISFASVDLHTGALTLSPRSIDMNGKLPDGWDGPAIPHGTVFYE